MASTLDEPEQVDVLQLWDGMLPELQALSQHERLQVAGEMALGITEVFCQQAGLLIQDWEDRHNTQGPVLDDDFLAGMVQETMFLDVSDLCRQPKSRKRRQGFSGKPVESVVGEVSKDAVLEFVEELESGEAIALKVSHEEDVSAWVGAILEYLEGTEGEVSFGELVNGLRMPVVAVWLGVLLGEFRVEQRGGFFEGEILIEASHPYQ
ncbi:hypothetical protein [Acaryochloris marina]|uniref:Uncharacterized protein n=1 Tax=Acaryochloris marina (strain MBIC 11017) TaxID=329726 RepID=A8ZQ79_ACAM1|nr:hypothetical protein [Acaryochloris marina]ABW33085.1 hypothetical protein AM1_F0099 [Acaryochloris marina MBIC11017]